MGYNMRSTGLNVAIKVKLQFRGISFPYLGQTDRKSFIYLKKKKDVSVEFTPLVSKIRVTVLFTT
jgi:hypothetical protein